MAVRAPTETALYEHAVMALADAIVDRRTLREVEVHPVEVSSPDSEALLVDLLGEVVYLMDARGFLPVRASLRLDEGDPGTGVTGSLYGCGFDASSVHMAVKAVTHHRVRVIHHGGGPWEARVVLDV